MNKFNVDPQELDEFLKIFAKTTKTFKQQPDAKEGVNIVVAARRSKEGQETVHIVKETGSDCIFVKTDVAKEASVVACRENNRFIS
jgi:hypothetical protein